MSILSVIITVGGSLSGQHIGEAVWCAISAVAPRASSIKVRDGMVTIGSSLQPGGMSKLELSGKSALGQGGGLQLAKILSESVTPSIFTALDIR